jgi:hypothetical protein
MGRGMCFHRRWQTRAMGLRRRRQRLRQAVKAQAEKEGGVNGVAQEGDTKEEETGAVSELVTDAGKKGGDAKGGGELLNNSRRTFM